MIRVEMRRDAQGRLSGLRCSGHAGAGPEGHDLVCSAVSALTTTAVNALEEILGLDMRPTVSEGLLDFDLPKGISGQQRDTADLVLRTIRRGLQDIQIVYPQFINVKT